MAIPLEQNNQLTVLQFMGNGESLNLSFFNAILGAEGFIYRLNHDIPPPPFEVFRIMVLGNNNIWMPLLPVDGDYHIDENTKYEFYFYNRRFESWGPQIQRYRKRNFIVVSN